MLFERKNMHDIILLHFRNAIMLSQTQNKVSDVFVDDTMCRTRSRIFRENNFNLRDAPNSKRPTDADKNEMRSVKWERDSK